MMTKAEMIERLERLSEEMKDLGAAVDYYGGMADWAGHGAELAGAGHTVESWVIGLKELMGAAE